MKCNICNKEKKVYSITLIESDGSKKEINICAECAEEEGIFIKQNKNPTYIKNIVCPKCGYTLKRYIKTNKVGCEDCYTIFKSIIIEDILKKNPDYIYPGPVPPDTKGLVKQIKKKQLKKLLDKAIENENYEEAARLRDLLSDDK